MRATAWLRGGSRPASFSLPGPPKLLVAHFKQLPIRALRHGPGKEEGGSVESLQTVYGQ